MPAPRQPATTPNTNPPAATVVNTGTPTNQVISTSIPVTRPKSMTLDVVRLPLSPAHPDFGWFEVRALPTGGSFGGAHDYAENFYIVAGSRALMSSGYRAALHPDMLEALFVLDWELPRTHEVDDDPYFARYAALLTLRTLLDLGYPDLSYWDVVYLVRTRRLPLGLLYDVVSHRVPIDWAVASLGE